MRGVSRLNRISRGSWRAGRWSIQSRSEAWLASAAGRMYHPETQHFEMVSYSWWEDDLDVCIEASGNMWVPAADAYLNLLDSTGTARVLMKKGADLQVEKRRKNGDRAAFILGARRFDWAFTSDGPETAAVMLAALS